MRWEALFADLEAQLDAAEAARLEASVVETTRYEVGRIALVQRLRAAVDDVITVGTPGPVVRGRVSGVGPDWLMLDAAGEVLVPIAAISWAEGLARAADLREPGRVWQRLGLRSALAGLARDRVAVRITCAAGDSITGTIDRVASDHLDLALHDPEEPRRAAAVRGVRSVVFGALHPVRPC